MNWKLSCKGITQNSRFSFGHALRKKDVTCMRSDTCSSFYHALEFCKDEKKENTRCNIEYVRDACTRNT
jgi:hypothetical protein